MKRLAIAALAGLLMAAPVSSASAQTVDLSTIKCKEFLESPQEVIGAFLMWLDGYFHDEDDPAIVDFTKMKELGGKLGAYCAANPTHGLITAAEPIFTK